jgi:hypothetical protein
MQSSYCSQTAESIVAVVRAIDRDVERGEDLVMLGYALLLMAPIFAPVAPPKILLPLMLLVLCACVCRARLHFLAMRAKLQETSRQMPNYELTLLPINRVMTALPKTTLMHGLNPVRNPARSLKSLLGGLLLNPLWMPIFYVLGLQFEEDKHIRVLSRSVMQVEQGLGLLKRCIHG